MNTGRDIQCQSICKRCNANYPDERENTSINIEDHIASTDKNTKGVAGDVLLPIQKGVDYCGIVSSRCPSFYFKYCNITDIVIKSFHKRIRDLFDNVHVLLKNVYKMVFIINITEFTANTIAISITLKLCIPNVNR